MSCAKRQLNCKEKSIQLNSIAIAEITSKDTNQIYESNANGANAKI